MDTVNIFSAENAEGRVNVARAVGSSATSMFIYDLAPGQRQSPYHYEYEEEWLLVVDGTLVLRAPDGEHTLERGDVVCFPAGPAGAHQLMKRPSLQPRYGGAVVGNVGLTRLGGGARLTYGVHSIHV